MGEEFDDSSLLRPGLFASKEARARGRNERARLLFFRGTQREYSSNYLNIALLNVFLVFKQ